MSLSFKYIPMKQKVKLGNSRPGVGHCDLIFQLHKGNTQTVRQKCSTIYIDLLV